MSFIKSNFEVFNIFIIILVSIIFTDITSAAPKNDDTCNISHFLSGGGRSKRSGGKDGVLVCITAKPGVQLETQQNKGKGNSNENSDDNDDDSSSDESNPSNSKNNNSDSDSDSDEDTSASNNHNSHKEDGNKKRPSGSGNNRPHSSSSSSRPHHKGKYRDLRVIVKEDFSYRNWTQDWTYAKNENGTKVKVFNKFSRVYARKSNHSRPNYAIVTNNKGGEFYMIAKSFPPFNNKNETLVIQFSIQFQSRAHCQLAFLRLFDCQFSSDDFGIMTPYLMQIGPHICGTSKLSRVSAEFQEPGKTTIKSVERNLEPINNTSVNIYALALDPDGTYHVIINTNATQNGTLKDEFHNYKGYTSICAVGLLVWHSVLDKYFKGQMIIDDILVVNDFRYAEKQRKQILNVYS